MITRRSALVLGLGFPALAAAGDFWNAKTPEQWSDEEIQRLLNNSPWAREGAVQYGEGGGLGSGRTGGGMGGGRGGMGGGRFPGGGVGFPGGGVGFPGGGGGRGGRGGQGGPGGQRTQMQALVRWESALPVREASRKDAPPEAAGHYLIRVTGLPVTGPGRYGSRRAGPNSDDDPEQARKQAEDRLKQATTLERHGKDPLYPSSVQSSEDDRSVLFAFPRGSRPIAAADKEVTFLTHLGAVQLKVKFPLKEMMYRGRLEL